MKKEIDNPLDHWKGFEDYALWYFYWDAKDAVEYLNIYKETFYRKYIELTKKWGILIPTLEFFKQELNIQDVASVALNKGDQGGMARWLRLSSMYILESKNVIAYPTLMFIKDSGGEIKSRVLVDVNRMLEVNYIDDQGLDELVKIWVSVNDSAACIYVILRSNAFYSSVWNKNARNYVDNYELALLNTPRFNSFLRDLKNLCFEFKATNSKFDNCLLEHEQNQNGILLQNEIIFYEDVAGMIPNDFRIH